MALLIAVRKVAFGLFPLQLGKPAVIGCRPAVEDRRLPVYVRVKDALLDGTVL